jgi:transcription termination/antitermination protein NusG
MASPIVPQANSTDYPRLPSSYYEAFWYAVYTTSNHEKRVAEHLGQKSVEYFLPLYDIVRRWKDRRMQLHRPLFPGYIFVWIALRDRLNVLKVPGVVRILSLNGTPTPIPSEQVDSLRVALRDGLRAEPHPYLQTGRQVRIKTGPLAGWKGIIVRRKGDLRVVLSADLIQRSIIMDIEASSVEPLDEGVAVTRWKGVVDYQEFRAMDAATYRKGNTKSDHGKSNRGVHTDFAL